MRVKSILEVTYPSYGALINQCPLNLYTRVWGAPLCIEVLSAFWIRKKTCVSLNSAFLSQNNFIYLSLWKPSLNQYVQSFLEGLAPLWRCLQPEWVTLFTTPCFHNTEFLVSGGAVVAISPWSCIQFLTYNDTQTIHKHNTVWSPTMQYFTLIQCFEYLKC